MVQVSLDEVSSVQLPVLQVSCGGVLFLLSRCPPCPYLAAPGVRPVLGRGVPRWDLGATCLAAPGVRGLVGRVSSWDQSYWSRVTGVCTTCCDSCHPGVPWGCLPVLENRAFLRPGMRARLVGAPLHTWISQIVRG